VVGGKDPATPARGRVTVVVVSVIVVVENGTHLDFLFSKSAVLAYLRAASTSAGCTICPVLLDQLFLV